MMRRRIVGDLHNHSTASDGEFSPAELVRAARDAGLEAVALTDHDTIAGLPEALAAARELGIRLVTGAEATVRFRRDGFVGSLHLLLYFRPELLEDEEFCAAIKDVFGQGRGAALVRARVEAINAEFGPEGRQPMLREPLTDDQIHHFSLQASRRHFALALAEFHGIQDREQINAIIGNASPAYVPSGIDIELLPGFLERYPVVPIFAHPAAGSFPGESHYKEVLPPVETVEGLLPEFLRIGIQGLEIYYPGHTEPLRERLLGWLERHELPVATGGSDCHDAKIRPLAVEGVTREELEALLERL
jgi:hypothetical protein